MCLYAHVFLFILFGHRHRPPLPPLLLPTRSYASRICKYYFAGGSVFWSINQSQSQTHIQYEDFFGTFFKSTVSFYPRTSCSKLTHNQPPPANKMITPNHISLRWMFVFFIVTLKWVAKRQFFGEYYSSKLFYSSIWKIWNKNLLDSLSHSTYDDY